MKLVDMSGFWRVFGFVAVVLVTLGWVTGCGTGSGNRAPVEDRMAAAGQQSSAPAKAAPATAAATLAPVAVEPSPANTKPLPGIENAGKPGYYTVKPGDTLIRIGLDHGQSARDIARWSAVENPNRIEIGQVLRVAPPASTGVVTRPVSQGNVAPVSAAPAAVAPSSIAQSGTASQAPASSASSTAAVPVTNGDDELVWIWPSAGSVIAGFDESRNKGLDIGGAAGDAVVAAADGRVVYVGAGLRGYGNLIILKHNNSYLTAYAHNQTLLIKEDQTVRKGQKIAEMGSSDADRVKLHFEIRRQGKPVDPARYLPPR